MEQLVWRVQNELGEGPYSLGAFEVRDTLDDYGCYDHPGPGLDIPGWEELYKESRHFPYIFGFETKDQALVWFGEALQELAKHGYILQQVRAKKVLLGGMQVAFIPAEVSNERV